ncbi:MAG: WYL domain-containing protein [Bacteroidales bacterium]|nr:WYL domain-containing protein [Bacteroidales bacterium]
MPANKNAVTRYYILDKLLANHYHHYSTEDLCRLVNEELEERAQHVSRRTIELDLHYLEYESPFVAEIEHYQIDDISPRTLKTIKKCCHRYVDPNFSIFKKEMTEDEKYLLNEALSMLGQFEGLPNLEGLESLRKGLKVKEDRQIVSFTRNPLENSTILGELFTTISQQQVVELHYHRFDTPDEDRQLIVHPYLLKEYNRRWYLIAAADNDGKLLNYALDRIDKVVPLPARKYIPYEGDLNERFEDIIGVTLYEDRPVQTIVFWVSDYSKDYVATKPLHESQRNIRNEREDVLRQQYPMLEGGRFFSIECIENYEFIRELTSFGKDLLVLSPTDIQQKVLDRVASQIQAYQSLAN